jgi:hypothetical protein
MKEQEFCERGIRCNRVTLDVLGGETRAEIEWEHGKFRATAPDYGDKTDITVVVIEGRTPPADVVEHGMLHAIGHVLDMANRIEDAEHAAIAAVLPQTLEGLLDFIGSSAEPDDAPAPGVYPVRAPSLKM